MIDEQVMNYLSQKKIIHTQKQYCLDILFRDDKSSYQHFFEKLQNKQSFSMKLTALFTFTKIRSVFRKNCKTYDFTKVIENNYKLYKNKSKKQQSLYEYILRRVINIETK